MSYKNVVLADSLMYVLGEKYPFVYTSVVYTYLRVIEDHAQPNLAAFLEKEVTFVITLIRE